MMSSTAETRSGRALRIRPGDIVVILLVLAAAAASMLLVSRANAGEKGTLAIIEVNGREVRRVTLGANQPLKTITIEGWRGPSTFEVEGGKVRMIKSACRDKICISMGRVDTDGRSIVCLPNRVVIRVTGSRRPGEVDTITE